MVEQEQWPGLWICPDYNEPINFAPPFKYKCTGMMAEKIAHDSFAIEMMRQICERN